MQPWRHNVGRAILQTPKVYFFDTGLVRGDDGVRLENAVAAMLLKHVHFRQDARGKPANLHYIRTKDGAEVDFALSDDRELSHLIECRLSDSSVHRALAGFANKFPGAEAIQLVRDLRQEECRASVRITGAAGWLAGLEASAGADAPRERGTRIRPGPSGSSATSWANQQSTCFASRNLAAYLR